MLRFISNEFCVPESIIKRLVQRHCDDCAVCGGKRVIRDNDDKPHRCECWNAYHEEYIKYAANIPPEFHNKSKNDLTTEWREHQDDQMRINLGQYLLKLKEAHEKGFGLYLHGEKGAGSSVIGAILLNKAIEEGMTAYFMMFRDFINVTMQSLRNPELHDDIDNLLTNVDFLMFDEVDAPTAIKSREVITSIIPSLLKKRAYAGKPTIVTSSCPIDMLPSKIGDQISSALTDRMSQIILRGNFKKKTIADLEREFFHVDE